VCGAETAYKCPDSYRMLNVPAISNISKDSDNNDNNDILEKPQLRRAMDTRLASCGEPSKKLFWIMAVPLAKWLK
jgi:hypothetical protein